MRIGEAENTNITVFGLTLERLDASTPTITPPLECHAVGM